MKKHGAILGFFFFVKHINGAIEVTMLDIYDDRGYINKI